MVKKAPQAFRTITEVSKWLDEPAHVLRFWESKFPQIKPVKRAGGRRYYRPEDMELLGGIKTLLHDNGMTIKAVQEMLKDEGTKKVQSYSPELDFGRSRRRKSSKAKTSTSSVSKQATAQDTPTTQVEKKLADQIASGKVVLEKKPASDDANRPERSSHDAVNNARDQIAAAVGKQKSETAKNVTSLVVNKTADDLSSDEYNQLEELFYQLKRVRNRMNRAHAAL